MWLTEAGYMVVSQIENATHSPRSMPDNARLCTDRAADCIQDWAMDTSVGLLQHGFMGLSSLGENPTYQHVAFAKLSFRRWSYSSPTHVPQPLKEQLALGGRLIIPVGPDLALSRYITFNTLAVFG